MDNGLLLGLFQIDPLHNKVHLVSGLLALAASTKARLAKLCLKFFGGIYALLGILGFMFPDEFLAMQVNGADNILHIVLGLVAVMLGFKFKAPRKELSLAQRGGI